MSIAFLLDIFFAGAFLATFLTETFFTTFFATPLFSTGFTLLYTLVAAFLTAVYFFVLFETVGFLVAIQFSKLSFSYTPPATHVNQYFGQTPTQSSIS